MDQPDWPACPRTDIDRKYSTRQKAPAERARAKGPSASAARRRERCLLELMLHYHRVERRDRLREILARRDIRRLHRRRRREVPGLERVQLAAERSVDPHERWRWRPAGPEAAEAASTGGITANRRQRGI